MFCIFVILKYRLLDVTPTNKVKKKFDLITILGATASGKTGFAARLAKEMNGEIISADSRQVYRGMDIGTGKDYDDYIIDGEEIAYHLIDIVDAGYQYNVYEYQQDFLKIYNNIQQKGKQAILCGGSGMYIDAVLKGYKLIKVPVNQEIRSNLHEKKLDELTAMLSAMKPLHATTDTCNKKRVIRAIEIETYYRQHPEIDHFYPDIDYLLLGIKFDRNSRRRRISKRLKERLKNGMLDEVKQLLDKGLTPEQIMYYGLEYKFLTKYLIGELSYDTMFQKLETAIHQFAKRQMTWFRGMERRGMYIHWLDGYMTMDEKLNRTMEIIEHYKA